MCPEYLLGTKQVLSVQYEEYPGIPVGSVAGWSLVAKEGWQGGQHVRSLCFTFGKFPRARFIRIFCLLFLEKMCCVLPMGADTAAESLPDSVTGCSQSKGMSATCPAWKPLLLIVPLRLGINQINPVYIEAFKVSRFFS